MEMITRSERKRMYIVYSYMLRALIITLVEDYSILHAPYIDLFNIDQY